MNCPNCQSPLDDPSQRFCRACGGAIPEEPADPMIGQVIGGKYRVLKQLGEGGMGCVYKGEQQLGTKNRNVAIKTLHAQFSHDPKIMARFERECGTMAGLEHPNTIQVYDFGTLPDGQLYIVMEFVKGHSLADTLEKGGAMDPGRVEHILGQVCGSLEEAHAAGIVHRDLKPDNIVLCERAGKKDFVKVLDFGIAKQSGEQDKQEQKLTQAGMVLGTPPYMSPEQFTGKPIDARSDIYSLGVMAYEMLTGRLPFEAETAFEWATKHMTAAPTPLEISPHGMRAPEKMRQAVMRALGKRADERFATVREFFDAFQVGLPVPAAVAGGTAAMQGPMSGPRYTFQQDPVSGRAATQASDMMVAPPGFATGQAPMAPPGGTAVMQPGGPGPGGSMPPGAPPAPAYTPAAGNVAFPTPAAMPQPPVAVASGGGAGKVIAFVLVGLLVAGGGAAGLFFAMRARASSVVATTQTSAPSDGTGASTAGTSAPTTSATEDPKTRKRKNDGEDTSTAGTDETDDAAAPTQVDAGHVHAPSTATTAVTTTTVPTTQPTHVYVPACGAAGVAKANGRMAEYQRLANACRAAGGTPP